jgi:hypothetical protein
MNTESDEYITDIYYFIKHQRLILPNIKYTNSEKYLKVKDRLMNIIQQYKLPYEDLMTKLGNKYQIKIKYITDEIILSTPFHTWKISIDNLKQNMEKDKCYIILYHKNTRKNKDGWHVQKFKSRNIEEIFQSIYNHDYKQYNLTIKSQYRENSYI